ncbi:MAG: Ycf66 family protein [Cyanobacteria bacterium J06639_14]
MGFGTPVSLLIGLVLIVGAVALFFVDKLKPGYGRDSDKVYAILWLFSGILLATHWDMNVPESLQQLIMAGMLIAVTIENIFSRTPASREDRYAPQYSPDVPPREPPYRPSRPSNRYRDREGGARMNVRAELENDRAFGNSYGDDRRMLTSREDRAAGRSSYYGDDAYTDRYADDRGYAPRSGAGSDKPVGRLNPGDDRIRRRRPKSIEGGYDARDAANGSWDESSSRYNTNTGGYSSHSSPYPDNGNDSDSYVDYRPVKRRPDDEPNSAPSDYGSRY